MDKTHEGATSVVYQMIDVGSDLRPEFNPGGSALKDITLRCVNIIPEITFGPFIPLLSGNNHGKGLKTDAKRNGNTSPKTFITSVYVNHA